MKKFVLLVAVPIMVAVLPLVTRGFVPFDGAIIGGLGVHRDTLAPIGAADGDVRLKFSAFHQPEGGTPLFIHEVVGPLFNGFFSHVLMNFIDPQIPDDVHTTLDPLFLEIQMAVGGVHAPALTPRLRLLAIPGNNGPSKLEIAVFSRETPTSPISLRGRLREFGATYDAVDVQASVHDQNGAVLFTAPLASAPADGEGFFTVVLAGIPANVATDKVQRILGLGVTARHSGTPVSIDVYAMPVTFMNDRHCVELLHLLPAGSTPPPAIGGSFGCPAAAPPPPPPPPDPLSQCQADLAVAEQSLSTCLANLEAAHATIAQTNAAVSAAILRLQTDFRQVFNDPSFVIPGTTPLEQIQAINAAVLGLNKGRKVDVYRNLGGGR